VRYVVENAGEASYADAFRGYSTFASSGSTPFDARSWTRASDTSYEDGRLTWTHVHRLRGRGGGGRRRRRGRRRSFHLLHLFLRNDD
jgi:hypothetical protein